MFGNIFLVLLVLNSGIYSNEMNFLFSEEHYTHFQRPPSPITENELQSSVNYGEELITKQLQHEDQIQQSPVKVDQNSISHAQVLDGLSTQLTIEEDQIAQKLLGSTRRLLDKCIENQIPATECISNIHHRSLPDSNLQQKCFELRSRSHYKPYRRILVSNYKDKLYKYKSSSNGISELPNPRLVSSQFFNAHHNTSYSVLFEEPLDIDRNVFFVIFTQFIEHDISKTVIRTMKNGENIECCRTHHKAPPRYTHRSCSPLEIPKDDYFYENKFISCLNYVRSSLYAKCEFGSAEQINEASNFFDLSHLYGNTIADRQKLRTFQNGLLKTSGFTDDPVLSEHIDKIKFCLDNNDRDDICYQAGDSRVNVNPFIAIIYTTFLRSHNQLAERLSKQNSLSDESIFQQARKLNIAIYQQIIYKEWSRVVMGSNAVREINEILHLDKYKNKAIGTSNEFSTAAIRFYNSMLPGDFNVKQIHQDVHEHSIDTNLIVESSDNLIKLENVFYRPLNLSKPYQYNNILDTILTQRAMEMDSNLVDDLSMLYYRAFHSDGTVFGTDVLALDIMRGRDHGLNGYAKYASHCLNKEIKDWNSLNGIIRPKDLNRLKEIYTFVDDVDLIVGLYSEIPINDGTVGPTSVCIIGEQLMNSKVHDPNFYDKQHNLMTSIQYATFSKLLCATTNLEAVPKNAFYAPSDKNELVKCANYKN